MISRLDIKPENQLEASVCILKQRSAQHIDFGDRITAICIA